MKLQKKKIKNLALNENLKPKQTNQVVGGGPHTWGMCSYGCDTAVYLGCNSMGNCYSHFVICKEPF